jgi:hypothetical protein
MSCTDCEIRQWHLNGVRLMGPSTEYGVGQWLPNWPHYESVTLYGRASRKFFFFLTFWCGANGNVHEKNQWPHTRHPAQDVSFKSFIILTTSRTIELQKLHIITHSSRYSVFKLNATDNSNFQFWMPTQYKISFFDGILWFPRKWSIGLASGMSCCCHTTHTHTHTTHRWLSNDSSKVAGFVSFLGWTSLFRRSIATNQNYEQWIKRGWWWWWWHWRCVVWAVRKQKNKLCGVGAALINSVKLMVIFCKWKCHSTDNKDVYAKDGPDGLKMCKVFLGNNWNNCYHFGLTASRTLLSQNSVISKMKNAVCSLILVIWNNDSVGFFLGHGSLACFMSEASLW